MHLRPSPPTGRERARDEASIDVHLHHAEERAHYERALQKARRRHLRRTIVGLTFLAAEALWIDAWVALLVLTLWGAAKTFDWWSRAYGLLPSHWLDPGNAQQGFAGWVRALLWGVY